VVGLKRANLDDPTVLFVTPICLYVWHVERCWSNMHFSVKLVEYSSSSRVIWSSRCFLILRSSKEWVARVICKQHFFLYSVLKLSSDVKLSITKFSLCNIFNHFLRPYIWLWTPLASLDIVTVVYVWVYWRASIWLPCTVELLIFFFWKVKI
jgi:hypothetical protein